MRRLPDWNQRLAAYVAECGRRPFEPGAHDCALFAAGAVEAMTGEDPAAEFRGRYASLAEGLRALREAGIEDHVAAAAAALPEIAVRDARPGDLAAVRTPEGLALGVVQGPRVYVARAAGVGLAPIDMAERAFRVAEA